LSDEKYVISVVPPVERRQARPEWCFKIFQVKTRVQLCDERAGASNPPSFVTSAA